MGRGRHIEEDLVDSFAEFKQASTVIQCVSNIVSDIIKISDMYLLYRLKKIKEVLWSMLLVCVFG